MKQLIAAGGVLALALTSCASIQDKADDACATVKEVVNAQPVTADHDTGRDTAPRIAKEIDAAVAAEKEFAEAGADGGFRDSWQKMTKSLREVRDVWQDALKYTNSPGGPGSDLVAALNLADYKTRADDAQSALATAAGKAGYPGCANIPWRY
ncbi:hypothetical protein [Amycolatopsis jejuensis]|uniref:hypothetical protein n=1 Tax=Amycolatopsis jejuensis TaxID=330084 RepID=UPI00052734B3|nr:hypothetical protein [Amycolatopsis jejuensis]